MACKDVPNNAHKAAILPGREDDGVNFIASMRKRFGAYWPDNYRHKEGTVILVDQMDRPIFHDNGDGTLSGLDMQLIWKK